MQRNILIVDDDDSIRNLFKCLFINDIYTIHTAQDAPEASILLNDHSIDLIFLDLKLFGMNGIDLCRQIRRTQPLAMIHAMTGWAALFDIVECREAGFDDFFIKPLDLDLIKLTVRESFKKLDRWKQF